MATYYVDPLSGSDAAAGTSFGTAWATTQKAADTAVAGDEVRLCATATETPSAQIDWDTNAGTAASPIHFVGADSSGNPLTTGYYTISGSSLPASTNLFYWGTAASQFVRFKRIRITGATNHNVSTGPGSGTPFDTWLIFNTCRIDSATADGVYQGFGYRNMFINCEIDSNGGSGFGPAGASNTNRMGYIWFYGCSVHDNTSSGITLYNQGNEVLNSLIYDNGGDGIELGRQFFYTVIMNNTIYGNTGSGIGDMNAFSLSANNTGRIIGNTFASNGGYGLEDNRGGGTLGYIDYNHFYNNTSGETDFSGGTPGDSNQSGDPLFTSITDGSEDFTPTSGSPLIRTNLNDGNIGAVGAPASGGGETSHVFAV